MDQAKVKIIQDWPELQKVRDIQSFLGFTNFYQCLIFNYSDIVVPSPASPIKGSHSNLPIRLEKPSIC